MRAKQENSPAGKQQSGTGAWLNRRIISWNLVVTGLRKRRFFKGYQGVLLYHREIETAKV
jgi:hypothetical protein